MDDYMKIIFIFLVLIAITLAIICVLRKRAMHKKQEKIQKIASYILGELKDVKKVKEAQKFCSEYEMNVKKLLQEIERKQLAYEEEFKAGSFLNFGHKKRLDDLSKELENSKIEQSNYEINNRDKYQYYSTILESIDKDFFDINKERIEASVEKLNHDAIEQERLENQKKKEEEEFVKLQRIEEVKKEREEKIRQQENEERKATIAKTIQDLDEFMPILQSNVKEKQTLSFQLLQFIEQKLDVIEDGKSLINQNDFNNIERIEKKLNNVFNDFRQDKDFIPNINLIEDSFHKILSSKG